MLIFKNFIQERGIFLRDVVAPCSTLVTAAHLVGHPAPRHLGAALVESELLVLLGEVLFARDCHRTVLGVDGLGGFDLVTCEE